MTTKRSTRWMTAVLALALIFTLLSASPAAAAAAAPGAVGTAGAVFPSVIPLPDGWLPEGIAIGSGSVFYAGSRADGAIYRGSLQSGAGEVFIPGTPGRVAVGLKYHPRCDLLLVSGGPTGQAYVYNATTGAEVKVYDLSGAPAFINDVAVTNDAAYFTNSSKAELYYLDLSQCGSLPDAVVTVPLSGDWQQVAGFNANGIVAHPSGSALIVVNSTTGDLYRVDPQTGAAAVIDLGGAGLVTAGDGLLLRGQTLYVVRNALNQITVVKLNNDGSSGAITGVLSDPDLDIPTTVGVFGSALYAVNGRFTTPPTPTTPYDVVRVDLQ